MMSLNAGLTRSPALHSPVLPQRSRAVTRSRQQVRVRAQSNEFDSNWLNSQPIVPVIGFFAWTIPTNLSVPQLGGKSLFGEFLGSIAANLSHFPTGPALTDPFWLYFSVYHVGLFLTIFLGQIGVNARKQGYFSKQ